LSPMQTDLPTRPLTTDDELANWLRLFCNLRIPREAVCANHSAPFDYVRRAYFEPTRDQVVHAPRGGGKTRLAAAATLLDLLHKPGIAVRILGGSLEQSLRMWEHLLPDLERICPDELGKRGASKRIALKSRSSCAVLTQSQRAVRGLRVQKLRCDEVELFDPDIWEAAQLVTRSLQREQSVSGAIDALSTLHEPAGLMQKILDGAERIGTPVVRWCLIDVLERCAPERDCKTCELWNDCEGIAKTKCDGFVSIDDAIAMKKRVSLPTWHAEMLCRRPSVRGSVFPMFDPALHVREFEIDSEDEISLGVDFGFAAPFVCLWIVTHANEVRIIDEYVQPQRTIDDHITAIRARRWPAPIHIACDPAGAGRSEQTARSSVQLLRQAGFTVRFRATRILDGVEAIRALLQPASGSPKLLIHPRCRQLIRALLGYRNARVGDSFSELPVKDGEHDHLIDALRYGLMNRQMIGMEDRRY
ncbi:MAG TPA: hypothetical protein PK402_00465, partial [Tepidisphaeraceae bacterium]|nr:hypothetical protein [Tepidisphaeraceae bacterium]